MVACLSGTGMRAVFLARKGANAMCPTCVFLCPVILAAISSMCPDVSDDAKIQAPGQKTNVSDVSGHQKLARLRKMECVRCVHSRLSWKRECVRMCPPVSVFSPKSHVWWLHCGLKVSPRAAFFGSSVSSLA